MKTQYNGIEITYDEDKNIWLFELRGRSRNAGSLAAAKEAIDKVPAEKRAAFPRFDAYLHRYDGWKNVTVTSVAEERGYGGNPVFWVSCGNRRSKEQSTSLYPVNEHNMALLDKINAIDKEIERYEKQKTALLKQMQSATIPAEIATCVVFDD